MKKGGHNIAAPLIALVMLGLGAPAAAQQSDDKTAADASQPNDGDIIVTANRVEQNLQDVSGVVQAFSGDDLRKSGITDIRNLQTAVPGLSIANQEGNVEIFIRGVGSSNNTELGDPGAAPHLNGTYIPRPRGLGVMFYDLDRVEVNKGPQGTLYGRNALAGTLNIITAKPRIGEWGGYIQGEYGNRNSYGTEGAINIPVSDTFAARAAGYYVNRGSSFNNVSTDPQASKLKPAGFEENYAGRLSLLWEPTSDLSVSIVGDYGRETGTGYPGANIYHAVTVSGLRAEDLHLRNVAYRGLQGDMTNALWGIQGKINYDFGPFALEATGSYRSVDYYQVNAGSEGIDYPGRNLNGIRYDNYSNVFWQTKSKSQVYEARLFANQDQAFRWSLGGFYFKEAQQVGYLSLADRGIGYSGTEFTMPDVNGQSYAFYADGTYDVTDRFRVIAGVRYTDEKKSRYGIGGNWGVVLGGQNFGCCFTPRLGTEGFRPNLLSRPNFVVPNLADNKAVAQFLIEGIGTAGTRDTLINQIAAIANGTNPLGTCFMRADINNGQTCPTTNPSNTNGGFSYANLTIPSQQIGSSQANFFDFRAGLEYDLSDGNMLYAKVSSGHKSGGFNDTFTFSTIPAEYKPEKVIVYEAGLRSSFYAFGRKAIFNVSGFYYDYNDQVFQDLSCINEITETITGTNGQTTQVKRCNGYSLANRNIGTSRIAGIEAETRFQLPGNYGLHLNASWIDTKIKSGSVADARAQDFSQGGKSPLIDLTGNRLPLASKFNVSAKLSQWFNVGHGKLDWQALLNYRSSYYLTQFNERDITFLNGTVISALAAGFPDKQKGYATLNLGLGYSIDNYRLEIYATNFLDEEASQKALVGNALNIRFLNDARSYGARFIAHF